VAVRRRLENVSKSGEIRVLLVGDEKRDRLSVTALLGRVPDFRYAVDGVTTHREALAAIKGGKYDVCLVDYVREAEDGDELLAQSMDAHTGTPIIFLTEKPDIVLERRLLIAGAADHVVKDNLDPVMLERSIRHSLERSGWLSTVRDQTVKFRAVFDGAPDAMLIADDEGRNIEGNAAALKLLELTSAQLVDLSIFDLVVPSDRDTVRAGWEAFVRDGRIEGDLRIMRSDGTERLAELRATARFRPGRHLSVLRDVTERRLEEARARRLATFVESAADAIEGISLEGIIDYWSPAAERMYGYPAAEVIGTSKSLLFPNGATTELDALLGQVKRGEPVHHVETVQRRKDGTTFAASLTVSPVIQMGQIVAASVITQDISERKRLEDRLAVSDRMASVGILAAGVAHEINNPLASMIANLEYLSEEIAAFERDPPQKSPLGFLQGLRETIEDTRAASARIRHVVRDLKLFSKPDEERRGPVDVERVIESTLKMASNEIRHRARVVKRYAEVLPVAANEGRLGQVFLNLIVNAAQAIPEGEAHRNQITITTSMDVEGRVVTEIGDTGAGISPANLERMFEPFFSTKPAGVGTGLGLSICRRIVHEFGGTITVESTLGAGTTFRVALPGSRGRPSLPANVPLLASPGHILVIDDEPLIVRALKRILAPDYRVTYVTSGAEAIALVTAGERYDAILCEMTMPQMTGTEIHDQIFALTPAMAARMVFLTGGACTGETRAAVERASNARVDKPFDPIYLRRVVLEQVLLARADESD